MQSLSLYNSITRGSDLIGRSLADPVIGWRGAQCTVLIPLPPHPPLAIPWIFHVSQRGVISWLKTRGRLNCGLLRYIAGDRDRERERMCFGLIIKPGSDLYLLCICAEKRLHRLAGNGHYLSCVHSIMMVVSAQPREGAGCTASTLRLEFCQPLHPLHGKTSERTLPVLSLRASLKSTGLLLHRGPPSYIIHW